MLSKDIGDHSSHRVTQAPNNRAIPAHSSLKRISRDRDSHLMALTQTTRKTVTDPCQG